MTLSGKNLLAAEALNDALDLLDEARTDALTVTRNLQGVVKGAASQAAAETTQQVTATLVAQQQLTAQSAALAQLGGRVATVAALPAGQADGAQWFVEADASIYRRTGGAWVSTGFSLAQRPQAQLTALLATALAQLAVLPAKAQLSGLLAAIRAGTVRVLELGDSITETSDQNTYDDGPSGRLDALLSRLLPGVTLDLRNLALGGRAVTHYADPAYTAQASDPGVSGGFGPRFPGDRPWATVGQSWRALAEATAPHLVWLGFGMNVGNEADSAAVQETAFRTAIEGLRGLASAPLILLVTPMLPSGTTFGKPLAQMREQAAMIRSLAHEYALPCVDVSRLSDILRYGQDDEARANTTLDYNWAGFDSGYGPGYAFGNWAGNRAAWSQSADGATLTRQTTGTGGFITSPFSNFRDGEVRFNAKLDTDQSFVQLNFRESAAGYIYIRLWGWTAQLYSVTPSRGEEPWGEGTFDAPQGGGGTWTAGTNRSVRVRVRRDLWRVYVNGALVLERRVRRVLRPGSLSMGNGSDGYRLPVRLDQLQIARRFEVRAGGVRSEFESLGYPTAQRPAYQTTTGNGENHPDSSTAYLEYHLATAAVMGSISAALAGALNGPAASGGGGGGGTAPVTSAAMLSLGSGWSAFGNGFPAPSLIRDGRTVSLYGLVNSGAVDTVVGVLPVGFRPPGTMFRFSVGSSGQPNPPTGLAYLEITATGEVICRGKPSNSWIDLGCTFPAS